MEFEVDCAVPLAVKIVADVCPRSSVRVTARSTSEFLWAEIPQKI
jgi:hypothetical protein